LVKFGIRFLRGFQRGQLISLLSLGAKEFWVTKFKQLDLLTSRLVTYDLREQGVVIVVVVERTSPFAQLVVVAKSKQIKR